MGISLFSQILWLWLSLKIKNADFCSAGGLRLREKPKNLKNNPFRTILKHFHRVKISFLGKIWLFEKVYFTEIQKCQYFQKFWNFSGFLAFKSRKGIFLTGKFAFSLKLDPQQSRIWQFSFSKTIMVKIYWEFRLFPRFSKFQVRAKKSILSYLFNLIEQINLGGVDRLRGCILGLAGLFWSFWILRS